MVLLRTGPAPSDRPTRTLPVVAVRPLADDAVAIALAQPSPPLRYRAGQYVAVTVELSGVRHTRNYSLASVPGDPVLEIGVRRTPGGLVSTHLTRGVRPADRLEVSGPHGRFTLDHPPPRRLVLAGGGSGIVPLLALARAALAVHPDVRVGLVHADRRPGTVMYAAALDDLVRRYGHRFRLVRLLETGGTGAALRGRLDAANAPELLGPLLGPPDARAATTAYLCGPHGFTAAATAALTDLGLPAARIRTESFTPPAPPAAPPGTPVRPLVATVERPGEPPQRIPLGPGRTLLRSATAAGLDWPASCLVGDCGECRVRLLDGRVEMTSVEGLTEDEEAAGDVLPCVAHPLTDLTVAR